jgi:predicted AlkP superfamily phosphohydrolase/phosphomutase
MTSPTRVLVLAMDGADGAQIERWAADGTLPTIARLLERGVHGTIRGLDGFYIGSTWPSFYTGASPAAHGLHAMMQLTPGTYAYRDCAAGPLTLREPFWEALSRAGKRLAILDVPLSGISPSVNGVQTVEWGSHDAVYGFQAHPAALKQEILDRFGSHPLGPSCDGERSCGADYKAVIDKLLAGVKAKTALTREMLGRGGWDLFVQVFTESHCTGHQMWHLHDPRHPAHDRAIVAETGDPIREVYQAIDRAIREVLQVVDDRTTVLFLTAHGMSHWFGAHFLLREILFRLGAATRPPQKPKQVTWRDIPREAASWAWHRVPIQVRKALAPLRARFGDSGADHGLPSLGVDTAASRCLAIYNGLAVSGIRLNLVGREPTGVLTPGAEANAFTDALIRDLTEIVDERTRQPLIKAVRRTADLYSGEHLDHLPDLLVEWSDEAPTGCTKLANGAASLVRAHSPKIGTVEGRNTYARTGEHRRDGFFIACGPAIPPKRLDTVSLLDFAPTLTRLLGVELTSAEGKPIPEIVGSAQGPI